MLLQQAAKPKSIENDSEFDSNALLGAEKSAIPQTSFCKFPLKQNEIPINNICSAQRRSLLPSQFNDSQKKQVTNNKHPGGTRTQKTQNQRAPNRSKNSAAKFRQEESYGTGKELNSETSRSNSFTDESTPRLFSNDDYLKLTWVTPPSSVNSTLSHTALRQEIRRTEKLLDRSIEKLRTLETPVKEVKMNPRVKEAIRQEFRSMLEEHDSGSCTTSADVLECSTGVSYPGSNLGGKFNSSDVTLDYPNEHFTMAYSQIKCPICGLKVCTSLFTPMVLLPCQHVICELCAEGKLRLCPVCRTVVVRIHKPNFEVHPTSSGRGGGGGSCNDSVVSQEEVSTTSISVLTTDSDGSARMNPLMSEAEQLLFIRETKLNKEMKNVQFKLDQIEEAKSELISQVEAIEREEHKVMQEMKILEEKLHSLNILKFEHKDSLEKLRDREDAACVRHFLIKRSLDSIAFQRLEQELIQSNSSST